MKYPTWDELSIQEQLHYEDLVARIFPSAQGKELEEKAKKYYKKNKNPA